MTNLKSFKEFCLAFAKTCNALVFTNTCQTSCIDYSPNPRLHTAYHSETLVLSAAASTHNNWCVII